MANGQYTHRCIDELLSNLALCCSLTGNEHLLDSIKAVFTHSISGHFPFNSATDPEARSMDSFCQVTALITCTLVCSRLYSSLVLVPPSSLRTLCVCLIEVFSEDLRFEAIQTSPPSLQRQN